MGGSSSKSSTTINTSAAVNAITRNIMNCASNTVTLQELVVSGNYNVVSGRQLQTLKLSSACSQDAQSIANLQQEVSNLLKSTAEAQNVAVLGILGKSSSEVETMITNDVKQNITQETIANIVNSVNLQQKMIISGDNNIVKFSQEQTAELVFTASQKAINDLKSVQAINNAVQQAATSTVSNPISDIIDSVGNVFAKQGLLIVIVLIAFAIILGPTLIKAFFGGDSPNNPPMQRPMQPYPPTQSYSPMQSYQPYQSMQQPMQSYQQPMMQQQMQQQMQPNMQMQARV